jgi:hypothetical protein
MVNLERIEMLTQSIEDCGIAQWEECQEMCHLGGLVGQMIDEIRELRARVAAYESSNVPPRNIKGE